MNDHLIALERGEKAMTFRRWPIISAILSATLLTAGTTPAPPSSSNQESLADESMRHYQAILRLDTSNPPGNERLVVDYLQSVLDSAGIETVTVTVPVAEA